MGDGFYEIERRRGEVERHRENSARQASAFARYRATGIGSIEFEDAVDFGLTFIEQPFLSVGYAIDTDELSEVLGVAEDDIAPLPIVAGMVTDWEIDERGFYTGAYVGAVVYFPPNDYVNIEPDAEVNVEIHYTFTATALKDIPTETED